MLDLDKEMDKLAQLVALRAQRKMGRKPSLQVVGEKSAKPGDSASDAIPSEPEPIAALPRLSDHDAVDVSERAVKMEEVMRIAIAWKWPSAIPHFLQLKGVPYMSDLTDPQLDDLLGRMHGFVDAAETGCSLADSFPAL